MRIFEVIAGKVRGFFMDREKKKLYAESFEIERKLRALDAETPYVIDQSLYLAARLESEAQAEDTLFRGPTPKSANKRLLAEKLREEKKTYARERAEARQKLDERFREIMNTLADM